METTFALFGAKNLAALTIFYVTDCAELLGIKFTEWFLTILNTEPNKVEPEELFQNTSMKANIISEANSMAMEAAVVVTKATKTAALLNKIKFKYKLKFLPASMTSRINIYGQIDINMNGTMPERAGHQVVGLFTQNFIIINDTDPLLNNFKMLQSDLLLCIG